MREGEREKERCREVERGGVPTSFYLGEPSQFGGWAPTLIRKISLMRQQLPVITFRNVVISSQKDIVWDIFIIDFSIDFFHFAFCFSTDYVT